MSHAGRAVVAHHLEKAHDEEAVLIDQRSPAEDQKHKGHQDRLGEVPPEQPDQEEVALQRAAELHRPPRPFRDIASMVRIIDWNAVGAAFLEFAFCTILGLAELGNTGSLSIILLPIALIAFVALIQKLMGVVFDLPSGTVRFYSFWLRRRVSLADIRDANCEFGIPLSPTRLVFAFAGQKNRRGRSEARQRTYMVNLSGAFGSRQIRFHHKRWRDRFLSILRDQAPRCRITRWF